MNIIHKLPLSLLGYQFIDPRYLPDGKDEYYLRNGESGKGRNRNGESGKMEGGEGRKGVEDEEMGKRGETGVEPESGEMGGEERKSVERGERVDRRESAERDERVKQGESVKSSEKGEEGVFGENGERVARGGGGSVSRYRQLEEYEIDRLTANGNTHSNWQEVLVSDIFPTSLVRNCHFFGKIRIGRLEPYYREFHNLRSPVGLYNSTIISADLGDNVSIQNVGYLSHYVIGNDCIIVDVGELAATDNAKFGNGILKQGEPEARRIWLEVCNENGGRRILPFDGMLPGDAWLWSRFRDDEVLQEKLRLFTEKAFDDRRGYYGSIAERTVIKQCRIIKDVKIGTDAYIKGANKLKNLTIRSTADAPSQIGEGCELVNGIIGEGCRIFYGVKAVRFVMASHSQLKYGARLINSYLGNNSTISCCEVLNALLFPGHEQHHNNSFLCAALVMGQSNIAAGATIASNHNSRAADGEIVAGRGFWPGLCVSLKHNSRFASYTLLAKGDYPAELDIPLPFSLLSNDVARDELIVMPGYWFLYNLYGLARNSWKLKRRDRRIEKVQFLEYDFLAPDTIGEIVRAMEFLKKLLGKEPRPGGKGPGPVSVDGFENSNRKVRLIKVQEAYEIYERLVAYYAARELVAFTLALDLDSPKLLQETLRMNINLGRWVNMGGQLVREEALNALRKKIHAGVVGSWEDLHTFYIQQAGRYPVDKLEHALAALHQVGGIDLRVAGKADLGDLLLRGIKTREWMVQGIYDSRKKDYEDPFRRMLYGSTEEMNNVMGDLENNEFIKSERDDLETWRGEVMEILKKIDYHE